MGNTKDYLDRLSLVDEVQKAGRQLLEHGYNYIFKPDEKATRELAEAVIVEAQNIVNKGYNAKFACINGEEASEKAERLRLWQEQRRERIAKGEWKM